MSFQIFVNFIFGKKKISFLTYSIVNINCTMWFIFIQIYRYIFSQENKINTINIYIIRYYQSVFWFHLCGIFSFFFKHFYPLFRNIKKKRSLNWTINNNGILIISFKITSLFFFLGVYLYLYVKNKIKLMTFLSPTSLQFFPTKSI
jgi:hypothetical protein